LERTDSVFSRIRIVGLCALLLMAGCVPHARTPLQGQAPPRDYLILVNYELGMHCTGFDFSYCCVLPPYNSILAQVVRTERKGGKPVLLGAAADDPTVLVDGERRFKLAYHHETPEGVPNSYSAPKKLVYWGVRYDERTKLPDHVFSHLYIYQDLAGSNPENTSADARKKRIGPDLPVGWNRGPAGDHVGKGFLRYSGPTGTVVFTDSPVMENVPIQLSQPGVWEALGLPLTPFGDDFTALISLDETMVQPYQKAVVTLVDAGTEAPVLDSAGLPVRFFGLNPIDVPNCARCHANARANGERYRKYRQEYDFWRGIRGASRWYAELKAAAISILEIHDDHHGTDFLAHWPGGANVYTRLGRGAVVCQDCHADNVIGKLMSARGPDGRVLPPLTEAIHKVHQRNLPLPDALGRASGCQLCHPTHRSDRSMEAFPLTDDGQNLFAQGDIRDAKGCYTRRDVHANAARNRDGAETPAALNAIGEYLRARVMTVGGADKGLYCTHCHNRLSRELYKADHLRDAVNQVGETLRNLPLAGIAGALGVTEGELIQEYLDPSVPERGDDDHSGVYRTWHRAGDRLAAIGRIAVDAEGRLRLTDPDEDGDRSVILLSADPSEPVGVAVGYGRATHGKDYWLAPGEPHCADCHRPPFVESGGGGAFPIDQPGKYALMRYSKGHAGITCQGCHESTHGLYPVDPRVDSVSYAQAASLNPDHSHGPVKCGACHRVNGHGIPTAYPRLLSPSSDLWHDYGQALELQHRLR